MDFKDRLAPWSGYQIEQIIGCGRVAYYWKKGERVPPAYVQRLILKELQRRTSVEGNVDSSA